MRSSEGGSDEQGAREPVTRPSDARVGGPCSSERVLHPFDCLPKTAAARWRTPRAPTDDPCSHSPCSSVDRLPASRFTCVPLVSSWPSLTRRPTVAADRPADGETSLGQNPDQPQAAQNKHERQRGEVKEEGGGARMVRGRACLSPIPSLPYCLCCPCLWSVIVPLRRSSTNARWRDVGRPLHQPAAAQLLSTHHHHQRAHHCSAAHTQRRRRGQRAHGRDEHTEVRRVQGVCVASDSPRRASMHSWSQGVEPQQISVGSPPAPLVFLPSIPPAPRRLATRVRVRACESARCSA